MLMIDNQPWFVAKDVALALGYKDPQGAVRKHCKKAQPVGVAEMTTLDQQTVIIPESDIYRLIIRSKLPEAEKFMLWVCEDVLPSIRKTGSYTMEQSSSNQRLLSLEQSLTILTEQVVSIADSVQQFVDVSSNPVMTVNLRG